MERFVQPTRRSSPRRKPPRTVVARTKNGISNESFNISEMDLKQSAAFGLLMLMESGRKRKISANDHSSIIEESGLGKNDEKLVKLSTAEKQEVDQKLRPRRSPRKLISPQRLEKFHGLGRSEMLIAAESSNSVHSTGADSKQSNQSDKNSHSMKHKVANVNNSVTPHHRVNSKEKAAVSKDVRRKNGDDDDDDDDGTGCNEELTSDDDRAKVLNGDVLGNKSSFLLSLSLRCGTSRAADLERDTKRNREASLTRKSKRKRSPIKFFTDFVSLEKGKSEPEKKAATAAPVTNRQRSRKALPRKIHSERRKCEAIEPQSGDAEQPKIVPEKQSPVRVGRRVLHDGDASTTVNSLPDDDDEQHCPKSVPTPGDSSPVVNDTEPVHIGKSEVQAKTGADRTQENAVKIECREGPVNGSEVLTLILEDIFEHGSVSLSENMPLSIADQRIKNMPELFLQENIEKSTEEVAPPVLCKEESDCELFGDQSRRTTTVSLEVAPLSPEMTTSGNESETAPDEPAENVLGDDDEEDMKLELESLGDDEIASLECMVCGRVMKSTLILSSHLKRHAGQHPYQCDLCGHECASLGHLQNHIRTHTGEKPFKCEICGKCFKQRTGLNYHSLSHTGEKPYECDKCGKKFTRGNILKQHQKTHEDVRDNTCQQCGKTFSNKSNYLIHLRLHSDERPHECDHCGRTFRDPSNFRKHMKLHESVYECGECRKGFLTPADLELHACAPNSVKSYLCRKCDSKFTDYRKFERHNREHRSNAGNHVCGICGKVSVAGNTHKLHMRLHTGERPFKCTFCDQSFVSSSHCSRHLRKHTGVKPYCCAVCEKRFMRGDELNVHMRVHTVEKSAVCNNCGEAFVRSRGWGKHRKAERHVCRSPDSYIVQKQK